LKNEIISQGFAILLPSVSSSIYFHKKLKEPTQDASDIGMLAMSIISKLSCISTFIKTSLPENAHEQTLCVTVSGIVLIQYNHTWLSDGNLIVNKSTKNKSVLSMNSIS